MTSRTLWILVIVAVFGVLPATGAMVMLISGNSSFLAGALSGATMLSGKVPDVWSVPAFPAAPVVLPGVRWASLPARTADGALAGLVHDDKGQGSFVALDEGTGSVRWQVATGPLPASFVRAEGWRLREVAPEVPLTRAGAGVYLVAWDRTWMLVPDGGGPVKTGSFPDVVPPVSAIGGVCLVGSGFWIAIADGRDGGVMLSATGELAGERSDRPATCPGVGKGGDATAISPLQNARANPEPVAPDDPTQGYPLELCGKYSAGSRTYRGNEYCSDMRSDGGGERAVMLLTGEPTFRDGDDWKRIRLPIAMDRVDFHPRIIGFELAWPRAFFDMSTYRNVTTENAPAAGSFEPKRVETSTEVVEIVSSISRDGELKWAHTMQRGPTRDVATSVFYDQLDHYKSLLLASHPDSPVQNLYIFKPGMLLAVDQDSGAPRFQIGAPYPMSTAPLVERPKP